MDDEPRPVVVLARALDQARAAVTTLNPPDLDKPTPCDGWTVRDLLGHLLALPVSFLRMGRGQEVDWSVTPAEGDGGWAEAFRFDAHRLVQHWQGRAPDEIAMADMQTAELAVHTWDLLRATGHTIPLDPEVAERGLAFLQQGLTTENRGDAFGTPVEAPADAPPYDRLVAFTGRDPHA